MQGCQSIMTQSQVRLQACYGRVFGWQSMQAVACNSTTIEPAQLIRHSYCGKQGMHLEH